MSYATTRTILSGVASFFEHAAVTLIGVALIVVGLALGVTMIMLPVGVVVGLIGVLMVVGGLFVRIDVRKKD
jgi:membrane-bound ClpP family serine protease